MTVGESIGPDVGRNPWRPPALIPEVGPDLHAVSEVSLDSPEPAAFQDLSLSAGSAELTDKNGLDIPPLAEEPESNVASDVKPSISRRIFDGMRRNKAATVAGVVTVASLVANPLGETVEAIGVQTALSVAGAEAVLEGLWIYGAYRVLRAAGIGLSLTLRPSKIKDQFRALSEIKGDHMAVSIANNKSEFNVGMTTNILAAIGQVAVPAAAVMGNLPPSAWGVLAFGVLDLWATYALRQPMIKWARQAEAIRDQKVVSK